MFRNLFFLLCLFSSFALFAQTSLKITLEIRSESDGKPVPFAHAHILNTGIGSVANAEGILELSIPTKNLNDSLKISAIGYKTKLIPIQSIMAIPTIYLEEDVIELSEVTVRYVDQAKELIKKAITRIPVNYPNNNEFLYGFVRESSFSDSSYKKPYYQLEANTKILKESYTNDKSMNQVELLKGRIIRTHLIDSLSVKFYSALHLSHRFDFVKQRSNLFNLKNIDHYEYKLLDTLKYDGNLVFKLGYRSNKSEKHWNIVTIEDQTYAITSIETYSDGKDEFNFSDLLKNHKRVFNKMSVEYSKYNQLWHISRVDYETGFVPDNKHVLPTYVTINYITTNIETTTEESIPYEERFKYRDITYDILQQADSNYWDGQSTISLNEDEVNLFNNPINIEKENKPTERDKKLAFISKFASTVYFGIRNYRVYQQIISYNDDNISFSDSTSNLSSNTFYLNSGFQYKLNNDFLIEFNTQSSFKNKQYTAVQLGTAYRIQMNKKGRPFYSTMALGLSHSWLNNELASIAINKPMSINDTKFNSESIEISYGTREWALSPSYSLGVKLNSLFELQFKVNYFLPIQRKQGFYFLEEDGFIRKNTFITQQTKSFKQLSGQQLNNLGLSIGLRFSL
jgi:hypothetical protein